MEKPTADPFVNEIAARRGQITIFDIWKNRRRRNSAHRRQFIADRGRAWNIAVVISLSLGIWAAWADIVGGASFVRVFIVWMVASGVAFMVLTRLEKAALWGAAVSGVIVVGIVAAQARIWLETESWPGWRMADAAALFAITPAESNRLWTWFLERTAAGGFFGLGLGLLVIGLGLVWASRRRSSLL